jgi:molybdopterin-guanine dinucleotide biosynthesis protein B
MRSRTNKPPIISVAGLSGTGKTTLLERLIPELTRRGFRVGTVKHHRHRFEMDRPGKDSWRHKHAGASVAVVSSPYHIGMIMDVDHDHRPDELAPLLCSVEAGGGEPILKGDAHLVALVSDAKVDLDVPKFSTDDIEALADFLIDNFNLSATALTQHLEAAS